jgi:hypothetical protein
MESAPIRTPAILLAAFVWLVVAVALGASGALQGLRPPAPQLVVAALTAALLLAGSRHPRLRAWALAVDIRALVALHVTRFVGVEFLAFYRRGELPFAFAVPGAWGDIAVAATAILVLACGRPTTRARRLIYGTWNTLGLADILYAVLTATRLALANPDSMQALLRLPLSVLPTFLVPLIIASHVLIAVRLAWAARSAVDTRQAAS